MEEAEATQGNDAPESAAPAPTPELPAPIVDWSHYRGFQAVEEPGSETPERPENYSEQLAKELSARVTRFAQSVDDSIVLASDGVMRWLGDPIARVAAGEDLLKPRVILLADDALTPEDRATVETRLSLWIAAHVRKVLGALEALQDASDLPESAREIARAIVQALGVLERDRVRSQVKTLDQNARSGLRKLGVRFGSLYLYVPILLKPAARALCSQLWALRRGTEPGSEILLAYASAGRTSFANEGVLSPDTYRVAGFRLCGERIVRVDIIERLSDLIRAAIPDHMRSGSRAPSDAYGFVISPQMTSLTGCAGEPFASILRSLGFESHKVKRSEFEAANRKAPTEPIRATATPPTESAGDAPPPGVDPEAAAEMSASEEMDIARAENAGDSSRDVGSLEHSDDAPETMAELDLHREAETPSDDGAEAIASEPELVEIEAETVSPEPSVAESASPEPAAEEEISVAPAVLESAPESSLPFAERSESQPVDLDEAASESAVQAAQPASEGISAEAFPTEDLPAEDLPAEEISDATVSEPPGDSASAPEGAAAVEDEDVEIWRPAPRRPRPAPRPQRAPGEQREPGRFAGRRGEPRRHGRAPENTPAPVAVPGEPVPAVAAAPNPSGEPRRYEGRRDRNDQQRTDQPRPDHQRPDHQRHGDRPPRNNQPQRREEGRPQEPKRGGGNDIPRREPRPVVVDPDSPFAKLLALKPLLERRDKRP